MPHFQIVDSVEEALTQANSSRRDELGYCYHTFGIRLPDADSEWHTVLGQLVDAGWQLQGSVIVVDATDVVPRHVLVSMLHAVPRPLQIRGALRLAGEIHGEADLRGEIRS